MELLKQMQNRRSVRHYTNEKIPAEKLEKIIQSGLLAPTGRGKLSRQFIVVEDEEMLMKLSACRDGSAMMLQQAAAAIVVTGDTDLSDTWIEDCSIAMAQMHLMADALGLGSCWIQVRMRQTKAGELSADFVGNLLNIPPQFAPEAILSLGVPESHRPPRELADLPYHCVHKESF